MEDNVIKVSVRPNKQNSVKVSSNVVSTPITANSDTSQLWSQVSKNWAVSENIVDNTDYSSKHYAGIAKESAENAQNIEEIVKNDYNAFLEASMTANSELQATKENAITEIESNKINAVDSMNAVKNEAIDSINSTKTTILNDIEFVADGEKKEINELADVIKDNADAIINRVGISMFDTVLKDHVLTYEESKGLALQGTWVYKTAIAGERFGYPDFYTKCLEEYNEATSTETVNGVTVKVHSNGHKFYDIANKTAIDDFFNTMGLAWFYGVDTENERVFLPRNDYFEQMTVDISKVGDSVEAGLPNITGEIGASGWEGQGASGAFRTGDWFSEWGSGHTNGSPSHKFTFNASQSSAVYGNSSTVQPKAVKKLLYICVGNTVSDTSWVDVVTQAKGGVKDLEDKTNEGIERLRQSSTALTQTQITNCILEVPQRIKLELANGVLTLKAGSVVIVPNGFEADGVTPRFDYVTVESDLTTIGWANFTGMVFAKSNERLDFTTNAQITSGNSATLSSGNVWYDTVTNTVKRCNDGSTWTSGYSFPICLATSNGSSTTSESPFSSLDQVFNGMGYIGSTIWVDKGVKGLIPNGRNEDGTLNNIEYETSTIGTQTLDGETTGSFTLNVWSNGIVAGTNAKYDSTLNKIIGSSKGTSCFEAGQFYAANGKITSFTPKQPINLATRDMVDGRWVPATQNILTSVNMGARTEKTIDLSGYLPSDGYNYEVLIAVWANTGATSGYRVQLNILNEFLPEVRWITAITRTSNSNQVSGVMTLPVGLERNFTIKNVNDGSETINIISLGLRSYRRIGTNL